MERRRVEPAEVEAPALARDPGRQLAVQHKVRVAPDRAREMGVVLLRETEVPDLLRRVERPLHRAEHHHRKDALQRRALDLLQELREVLLVGEVAAGDAELREVRAQVLQLLGVRRLVEAREDLHAARPEFLRDGLVRRHHALLDHLVRFVVGPHRDAGHHPVRVDLDLGLGHLHVERTRREAVLPQLLRKFVDGVDDLPLRRLQLRPRNLLALQLRHHLLVGEARLGADDGLGERARDADALRVEGEEGGEGEAVLVRHKRADAVRELFGQHRHDLVHEVDRGRAPVRLAVERAAGRHEVRDVRDVDAQDAVARLVRLKGERVVVVARGLGVAREDERLPQIDAPRRDAAARLRRHAHALRLGDDLRREGFGQLELLHHGERVEGGVVRRTDDVRDLALGGEAGVLPAHEAHHDAVVQPCPVRVRHDELLAVGR